MTIELTPQLILTTSALLAAVTAITTAVSKVVRWFDRQKKQDSDITDLKATHNADIAEIKVELQLLTYGNLACLKGLKEQGCNGPVTEAITMIEKHLNKRAHE